MVLRGIVEQLLPRVGGSVQTLDLAYGKAVSNEMVSRINDTSDIVCIYCFKRVSSSVCQHPFTRGGHSNMCNTYGCHRDHNLYMTVNT